MFLAQVWVYTILMFLLHHPILITAISSLIDDKFKFSKDNERASCTVEMRTFTYNIVNLTMVLFVILNIIMYKLRELHEPEYTEEDLNFLLASGGICRCFSLAEILLATNNFDEECLIGKGGSAKVYKGVIDDGATTVAIKRLSYISKQAVGSMFRTEIEMLSKFRHSHLVSLVGYCHEWHEMILVFEYISQGTLSDHLHQSFVKGYDTLSWIQRLKICIGAAQGLDYLHTGTSTSQRVIHRDVKSTNILLDGNLEAKIADFGISKIVATNQGCTYVSTAVRGTFGYMDPSYFTTGRLTRKSDVYAFGVVLFEVLSGRRAVNLSRDDEQLGLAGWAQNCIKQGRMNEIIDSNLKMQISKKSLLAFVKIASQCLNAQPSCRPTIAEVVVILEFSLALQGNSDATPIKGAIYTGYSGRCSTAVEVVYGKNHVKPFEINRWRATFSRKVCQILSTSIRSSSVHSNAKNSRSDGRVSQKKAGIFTEENSRMRMNKMGILPDAQGLFANANLRMFSLAELLSATRGFNPDMILGENYHGRTFVSWLDEDTLAPSRIGIGMLVAIKRTNSYARLRILQAEVDLCGRFYHPYVLKPLGFCLEKQEFLVVYEYTLKGNVARYAYKDGGKSLSWVIWLRILIGAAKYLDFLHSSEEHIIFGDFTLSSILLDWNFNPKIGYSASARFGPKDGGTLITGLPNLNAQHCAASEGYFSPEYKKAGHLSSKNDVYAFGVVLLEILTGRRVIDVNSKSKKRNLVNKARPVLACERKVKGVVNPKLLERETCPKVVNSILSDVPALALKCLDLDPKKRPSMRQVLEILERVNAIIQ
nr:PREDICTED: receptor like protein kinase S.2-like isoform X1 [Daucus carota subsp. sativus]